MKRNMRQWVAETIAAPVKRPLPILSFPSVQLMHISVQQLVSSSDPQAAAMKTVADRVSAAASVSMMDLSVEAECFGAQIAFSSDEVPTVTGALISSQEEAEALTIPKVGSGRTGVYINAVAKAARQITDRPVFAGAIGPFSLAGRLLGVTDAMIYCYDEPEMVHTVLEKATAFAIAYCNAFKEAGANGVVIAEPLGGLLSPAMALEYSHAYVSQVIQAVQTDTFAVIYHNCGNNVALMRDDIYRLGAMGYHFGDAVSMTDMLPGAPADALVMGNVSPAFQFRGGTPDSIRSATLDIMEKCCTFPNFVISSGCDIPPLSPWENIEAFFAAAEAFYRK